MRFLLYQHNVSKCSWLMFYQNYILIEVVKINIYYVYSFIKGNNYSHKLRYEEYLEQYVGNC
jgi:hypothetical protein